MYDLKLNIMIMPMIFFSIFFLFLYKLGAIFSLKITKSPLYVSIYKLGEPSRQAAEDWREDPRKQGRDASFYCSIA